MDFLMESGFMHWMSERMSFTNWVKADFHETSCITLKFSAPQRLRLSARDIGSARGVRVTATAFSRVIDQLATLANLLTDDVHIRSCISHQAQEDPFTVLHATMREQCAEVRAEAREPMLGQVRS